MLRDHAVHFVVVAVLFLYPGIYAWMSTSDPTIQKLLFPTEDVMVTVFIAGLFAISFDFISGYTGYLSFGHSLFFGTAAYLVIGVASGGYKNLPVLGMISPKTGFLTLLLLSVLVVIILALVVGAVSFRLTGVYFAMITLGAAELGRLVIEGYFSSTAINTSRNFLVGLPVLGSVEIATFSQSKIPLHELPVVGILIDLLDAVPVLDVLLYDKMTLGGLTVSYMVIGLIVLICYLVMQRIIHSPFGRVMIAIRENEERASAIGYKTYYYKIAAFAISGAFAAVAGALKAGMRGQASPSLDYGVLERGGQALLATIIGGIGTLAGPLYGLLFDENLRGIFDGLKLFLEESFAGLLGTEFLGTNLDEIIGIWIEGQGALYTGLIFILFVLFVRGGLLGTLRLAAGDRMSKAFPRWVGNKISSLRSLVR